MEMETLKEKPQLEVKIKKGHTHLQWIVAIIANSSLFTYGLQIGWISPMTKILQSESSPLGAPLSDYTLGLVASLMPISALVSVPIFSYVADRYGRKISILFITLPHALSWLLKLISPSTATMVTARILCGIAAGACFNVIPMYTKEISQDDIRGVLGSLLIFLHNLGILAMYALGAYFDYFTVLYIVVGIPFVSFLMMLKCPESPGYLVQIGQYDKATEIIAVLRGLEVDDKSIQHEINAMKEEELYYKTLPHLSFKVIMNNSAWRRAFIFALLLMSVQTFNGNFTVVTYGSIILEASGAKMNPELQALSFPGVMMIGSIASILVVEKIGRKRGMGSSVLSKYNWRRSLTRPSSVVILIFSFVTSVLAQFCLATIMLLQHQGHSTPWWLPMLAIVMAMFGYAFGILPVPYIVMAEMFNIQIRAKLMCITVAFSWAMSSMQLSLFAPITNAFGMYTTFYVFTAVNLAGLVLVLLRMPETRGKTVDQIEAVLRNK